MVTKSQEARKGNLAWTRALPALASPRQTQGSARKMHKRPATISTAKPPHSSGRRTSNRTSLRSSLSPAFNRAIKGLCTHSNMPTFSSFKSTTTKCIPTSPTSTQEFTPTQTGSRLTTLSGTGSTGLETSSRETYLHRPNIRAKTELSEFL